MRKSAMLYPVALAAAAMLALAASSPARNLSISNESFRVTWTSFEVSGGIGGARCRVTLEGSFHARTFAKVGGTLIGAVTKAAFTSCEVAALNGSEVRQGTTMTQTLPWAVKYSVFSGSLPGIPEVVAGFELRVRFGTRELCEGEYGTPGQSELALAREAGGGITQASPVVGRNALSLYRVNSGNPGLCVGNVLFQGIGSVVLLGTTTRIALTLI